MKLLPRFRFEAKAQLAHFAVIDSACGAFEIAGRGCLVRIGEDEPRYATVTEIAARLEPHPDATMLLTAVSEAVERTTRQGKPRSSWRSLPAIRC